MKGKSSRLVVGLSILAMCPILVFAQEKGGKSELVSSETLITKIPSDASWKSFIISPNNKRAAYVSTRGGNQCVIIDGGEGDVREGKQYDEIAVETLIFSPDSRRVAYEARHGEKWFVIVDGVERKESDEHGDDLIFSPDSRKVAYKASREGKWFVAVDDVEEMKYDWIVPRTLIFSPDSKRIAYVARRDERSFIVVDGVEGKGYELVSTDTAFSPDGKRFAYVAGRGENEFLVVDGLEGKEYESVWTPVFSPDNRRVAYAAGRGKNRFVVVDGLEGKEYVKEGYVTWIRGIIFSPDCKRIAYTVTRAQEPRTYIIGGGTISARWRGRRGFVVVDETEGKEYDDIRTPIFSPDSRRVVYVAVRSGKESIVADKLEGNPYDAFLRDGKIVFDSPNALHALAVRNNEIFRIDVKIIEKQ